MTLWERRCKKYVVKNTLWERRCEKDVMRKTVRKIFLLTCYFNRHIFVFKNVLLRLGALHLWCLCFTLTLFSCLLMIKTQWKWLIHKDRATISLLQPFEVPEKYRKSASRTNSIDLASESGRSQISDVTAPDSEDDVPLARFRDMQKQQKVSVKCVIWVFRLM